MIYTVTVSFAKKVPGISEGWIRSVVTAVLKNEKSKRKRIGVYLTDDKEIREINRRFLNHDYATDVISFGCGERIFLGECEDSLGEIVVSVDTARSMAKELKISFKEELVRYLVHGTLHLLGYKDDSAKEKKKMFIVQEKILNNIV